MNLRKLELKDAPLMLEWMHDPDVVQNMQADFAHKTLSDCENFIRVSYTDDKNLHLAVVDDNNTYMGTVSLKNIENDAPNERTGIARSSATVKFLYGLAGSGSRQKVTIAYDIKWSERPIYVGIDSFGIGWIAADSSSHQLATKTASAVGEVSYCYASTGNSAGLSSSVDMDTSQSGGVVGTPVIINHQNTSTYGKHISGTVGVGTQSNSSNMETIQIFVAYAHSTVSVTFSADVALQWKQVGMSINFTPQKKTTIIARGNATFKYNGQGYQTAGTV